MDFCGVWHSLCCTLTMNTKPIAEKTEVEDNPILLPKKVAETILPRLDRLVASLFVLFHQYQKHHWLVEGPQFRDLHLYLETNYKEVHGHLDEIAERMTVLGGVPTGSPSEQQRLSSVEHEPEGLFGMRDMLAADKANEAQIAEMLRNTIKVATEIEDFGTETILKNILVKVEDRAHHLEHYLSSMSLDNGRATQVD